MSRIGRMPITVPEGVKIELEDRKVKVSGPKGALFQQIESEKIAVKVEEGKIVLSRSSDDRITRSLHGLYRTLIANMVEGVTKGYEKVLILSGVGWKAQMKGRDLELIVGYSHPVLFSPPQGIAISVEKEKIRVSGIDKQMVGETAAQIRRIRKVEPYKGKGLRYENEVVRRKVGKAGV
jgi:large subunit ribosomal protein L6